jgi:hypothetical protein
MYIILFYFTIQFYFNFPFNYIYSLDAQSKTLLRYIHFTFVTLTVKSITKLAGMTLLSAYAMYFCRGRGCVGCIDNN